MEDYAQKVKGRLLSIIREMAASPGLFVKAPRKDFTRKRKLTFENMLLLLLGMGGGSLQAELLGNTGYAPDTASTSAFVQQRDKLLSFAFEFILHEFIPEPAEIKHYKGYRVLAADGSDLHVPTNPEETENFFHGHPGEKGYNLLHLNALYDLCGKIYTDALVQNRRDANEHAAFIQLVDRSTLSEPVIIMGDRGFESYNNLAHVERKGWKYLIRIKDAHSSGIAAGLHLPRSSEFEVDVQRILTRKQTKEVKADPSLFRFLPTCAAFDFLDLYENKFYPISFRIVCFKIAPDTYETIITNLDRKAFPPSELKKLYNMRWGIETSFRALKYAVGLASFHSKRTEYITQEVFAALIMYNFSELIASHAIVQQKNTRYCYQINFALAVRICRHFLHSCDSLHPPNVEALILAYILPVRNGRCFPRNIHFRQAVGFNYRLA